ncbi:hypothetical protein ncot_07005 [Nocardioides sp. JQ2195]|uniref:hypothetical protein n=1 Tax=Nocardioides sp. JQ2195 TaxID=2592334 RepID=UPI00143EB9CF|nr:hypothetical protein [Nocardioides sp. JQ2195]QIX26376.1 hypothetical protein ncot_07005 [Nocardioides sp. JQ2195]
MLIVIGAFVLAGLFCGWLWHQLWAPAPEGVVYGHVPRFEDDKDFRGVGLYFLVAVVAGVLISLVSTFVFERDEVWTLLAVVVGSLAAGGVMLAVGKALGPDSAAEAARRADDFAKVKGDLHAPWVTVLTSFPGGAALGSVVVLTCFTRRRDRRRPHTSAATSSVENGEAQFDPQSNG